MCEKMEIEILKQRIQDLEVMKEKCTLTNDIKIALAHYIQSNEECNKKILDQFEINNGKINTWLDKVIWPITLIAIIGIIAYTIMNMPK